MHDHSVREAYGFITVLERRINQVRPRTDVPLSATPAVNAGIPPALPLAPHVSEPPPAPGPSSSVTDSGPEHAETLETMEGGARIMLPDYPHEPSQIQEYLRVLTPIIGHDEFKKRASHEIHRLKFTISNFYLMRLAHDSPKALSEVIEQDHGGFGPKLSAVSRFFLFAQQQCDRFKSDPEIFPDLHLRLFTDDELKDASAIRALLETFPVKSADPQIPTPPDSPSSSVSSEGRDSDISTTVATLRRMLRNFWQVEVQPFNPAEDQFLKDLMTCSITPAGTMSLALQNHPISIDLIQNTIRVFPIEIMFVIMPDGHGMGIITAMDIGVSHHCAMQRDLTTEEKGHAIMIHNHPNGEEIRYLWKILFIVSKKKPRKCGQSQLKKSIELNYVIRVRQKHLMNTRYC